MMFWQIDDRPDGRGMLPRLMHAITLTATAVFLVSGYLGLRALAWGHPGEVSHALAAGVIAGGAVGGVTGLVYVVFGAHLWRLVRIDGLSVQVGALVGMTLYGGYNALALWLRGVDDLVQAALQGGIDGLLIGAATGALVTFVGGRTVEFSRAGCGRYLLLYFGVLTVLGVGVLVDSLAHVGALALAVVIALLAAVKLALPRVFGRQAADGFIDDDFGGVTQPAAAVNKRAAHDTIDDPDDDFGDATQRSASADSGSNED